MVGSSTKSPALLHFLAHLYWLPSLNLYVVGTLLQPPMPLPAPLNTPAWQRHGGKDWLSWGVGELQLLLNAQGAMRQHRRAGLHQGCREQGRGHGAARAAVFTHEQAQSMHGLAGTTLGFALIALTNGAVAEVHSISLQHEVGQQRLPRLQVVSCLHQRASDRAGWQGRHTKAAHKSQPGRSLWQHHPAPVPQA